MCKGYLSWVIIFLCIISFSCTKGDDNGDNPIINIPVDFTIEIQERLSFADGRTLEFVMETTKTYECENYEIRSTIGFENGALVLAVDEINSPQDCIEGESTAQGILAVEELLNGNYPFIINLRDAISNAGTFHKNDQRYQIFLDQTDGIELSRSELMRVPANTIWGYFDYQDSATDKVSQAILSLQDIAQETTFLNGDYGYFSIEGDAVNIPFEVRYNLQDFFIYQYDGNADSLQKIVNEFNTHQDATMKLFTSSGTDF